MLKAIIILPFNVLVVIPAIILYFSNFSIMKIELSFLFLVTLVIFAISLVLMVWSVALFGKVKKGSPAPWDPINKLIITGPYQYMRNPMLTGVFLALLAEALFFQSWGIFYYFVIFIVVNMFYFPLSEEKDLLKRYGKEYEEYKANVPRYIPRLTPWKK